MHSGFELLLIFLYHCAHSKQALCVWCLLSSCFAETHPSVWQCACQAGYDPHQIESFVANLSGRHVLDLPQSVPERAYSCPRHFTRAHELGKHIRQVGVFLAVVLVRQRWWRWRHYLKYRQDFAFFSYLVVAMDHAMFVVCCLLSVCCVLCVVCLLFGVCCLLYTDFGCLSFFAVKLCMSLLHVNLFLFGLPGECKFSANDFDLSESLVYNRLPTTEMCRTQWVKGDTSVVAQEAQMAFHSSHCWHKFRQSLDQNLVAHQEALFTHHLVLSQKNGCHLCCHNNSAVGLGS